MTKAEFAALLTQAQRPRGGRGGPQIARYARISFTTLPATSVRR